MQRFLGLTDDRLETVVEAFFLSYEPPMQWHPIFAQLLRPLLQDHYQVDTNVPVGDAPREADIVLLRRTSCTGWLKPSGLGKGALEGWDARRPWGPDTPTV